MTGVFGEYTQWKDELLFNYLVKAVIEDMVLSNRGLVTYLGWHNIGVSCYLSYLPCFKVNVFDYLFIIMVVVYVVM